MPGSLSHVGNLALSQTAEGVGGFRPPEGRTQPKGFEVKEYTAPGGVDVPAADNVVSALMENAEQSPTRPALAYREGDGFVDISTADFAETVSALAAGLVGIGIEPGDRVCIFMPTRVEFTYFDYAIWSVGATAVTIYESSSPDQVEWIVGNSDATGIICGTLGIVPSIDRRASGQQGMGLDEPAVVRQWCVGEFMVRGAPCKTFLLGDVLEPVRVG
jgi:non-ribosomal peptide synthetase component F